MATIDALITALRAYTGETSTTAPDATILEALNTAMRRMQRVHGYQGPRGWIDVVVGTQGGTALPVDFVREYGVYQRDTTQTDPSRALRVIPRTTRYAWTTEGGTADAERDAIYPNVASASASSSNREYGYWIQGGEITIVPSPTTTLTVAIEYERTLPDLVSGSALSNWFTARFPDVVREGGLAELYRYLHEWEVAGQHEQRFAALAQESRTADEAGMLAGPPQRRGR